jgi:dTDP-4-dehydrorhamnose reductase
MKKLLIMGSRGNLGMQLQKVFEAGFTVFAWGKDDLDITNESEVKKKINEFRPDIIINAAAYNEVDKCEENSKEFELAKRINGNAVGYLAKASKKIGATFIHYSTDYVFDGNKKEGYNEDDMTAPINNYGKSKLLGEEKIKEFINDKNFNYYIIRTSKLFGGPGLSSVSKKSFFDTIIELIDSKKELKIVDEELSLFTYTVDLARETKRLIEDKKERGIYHITNAGSCTWYEAVRYIVEIINRDVKIIPVGSDEFPRSAKRPKYSVLLNTKLKPLRSWKEALKEYINI